MVMGLCHMLQRLNGAQIAMQILRKSDHGAEEDARDRKVQGYSHIFTLTIQDTKWYHVLEMMFWQIGTPNKAWWHEVCPRQIQSSFQRRHGSRDFHIWLSLISGLCVDEISYTVINIVIVVYMTEDTEQLGKWTLPFLLFQSIIYILGLFQYIFWHLISDTLRFDLGGYICSVFGVVLRGYQRWHVHLTRLVSCLVTISAQYMVIYNSKVVKIYS